MPRMEGRFGSGSTASGRVVVGSVTQSAGECGGREGRGERSSLGVAPEIRVQLIAVGALARSELRTQTMNILFFPSYVVLLLNCFQFQDSARADVIFKR